MQSLKLNPASELPNEISVIVPASKSLNNRFLILKRLYFPKLLISNESNANDTQLLKNILENNSFSGKINAQDAGTAFRFLTALLACLESDCVLTGSDRMLERPIAGLVDMLQKLGCEIGYQNESGFPPLRIKGQRPVGGIHIRTGNTASSQFYSALAMIAPYCEKGLSIEIPNNLGSKPYWDMTLLCMKQLGLQWAKKQENLYEFTPYNFKNSTLKEIQIEADWSAASFWFILPLIEPKISITIKSLTQQSIQGDCNFLIQLAPKLGLEVLETKDGIRVSKTSDIISIEVIDFSSSPDISMNLIVAFSLLKKTLKITGLESLKLKESNRTEALQTELQKIGVNFSQHGNYWLLDAQNVNIPKNLIFETYQDHRIAIAFSYVGFRKSITIDNPNVVNKSYPNFWEELGKVIEI